MKFLLASNELCLEMILFIYKKDYIWKDTKGSEAFLGVDYSMLYSMQTLPAASWGGILGDVGDNTAKPRNMKVRTKLSLSGRSLEKTRTTCSHFICSSAASNRATSASREPSGSMQGGRAT